MTVVAWVSVGLVICLLLLTVWVVLLQWWSRVYRDVIASHTRVLAEQDAEINALRNEILEANIRLDRLDPR
jgi:hypothetical protein